MLIRNSMVIYLFAFGLFLCLISPYLLSEGMFVDGTIYATISRNLSQGIGSLWQPYFTATRYPSFHEHPPLFFWMEGIFFKLFGNALWIEKIFSFSTILIQCLILRLTWKQITTSKNHWIPVVLWLAFPIIQWTATNNMLENVLMIFCGLSAYFFLMAQNKYKVWLLILSGILIALGFLVKGPVALFPIIFPFVHLFFQKRNFSFQNLFENLIPFISALVFIMLVYFSSEEVKFNLDNYFNRQVIRSLTSIKTVDSRFKIVFYLFSELIIPLALILIILVIQKFTRSGFNHNKAFIFTFLFTGLCAVLPMIVSLKQSRFYIIPSLSFFVIAFALIIDNLIKWPIKGRLLQYRNHFSLLSIFIFSSGIFSILFHYNTIGRDKQMIRDLHKSELFLDKNTIIHTCTELKNNFGLEAYYARYLNVSFDDQQTRRFELFSTNCSTSRPKDSLLTPENKEFYLFMHIPLEK